MLIWALFFFALAVIAALIGFVARPARATRAARIAFGICFVIGAILFFIGVGINYRVYPGSHGATAKTNLQNQATTTHE